MNILVTGGAGYIGSITVTQLLEAGLSVVVYDNLSHGHKKAIHKDARFVQGDIADKVLVEKTLKEYTIDAVVHFAAYIEAGESMVVPEKYFRNNTIGTLSLLEAMLAAHVKTFVFSSTAAVYGDPEEVPIKETARLAPTNAYGASKLMVEQMLSWFHQIHGLSYAALRYFNAAGATDTLGEDHQPESHLIPLAIAAVMGTRPSLQLYGTDYETKDGTCIRDYIHVSDLASAHVLALQKLMNTHTPEALLYNLGSQHGFTNREVIETVGRIAGKAVPYKEAPRRPGDPTTLIASSEKIQKELGWKPRYTNIEQIVQSAWEWRKNHPKGYK